MSTTTSNRCTPISISRNPNSPKPFRNAWGDRPNANQEGDRRPCTESGLAGGPDAKKVMRGLGIDCGSRVTGYGVIDSDGAECCLVRYGAIRSKSSDPLPDRPRSIHNSIVQIIRDL